MDACIARIITAMCYAAFWGVIVALIQVFLFWGGFSWIILRVFVAATVVISLIKKDAAPEWFTLALFTAFSKIGSAFQAKNN